MLLSRQMLLGLTVGLLLLATAEPAKAEVINHALDDGTSEFATGFSVPGGSVVFANRFTTVAGGEFITSISVAYGQPGTSFALPGTPLQVILFRDSQGRGTPTQPVLLQSAPTAVTNPNTNTFIEVPLTPTFVEGDFFVGVLVSNLPANGLFPISFDRTPPNQGQSFGAWFTTAIGLGQLGTMSFNPTVTSDQSLQVNSNTFVGVIDGDYLIRAQGLAAVPEPSSLALAGLGALCGLAYRRRWRR